MATSYLLSRSLVPTMVHYMLGAELDLYTGEVHSPTQRRDVVWRAHERFNVYFERFRHLYGGYLDWALDHPRALALGFAESSSADFPENMIPPRLRSLLTVQIVQILNYEIGEQRAGVDDYRAFIHLKSISGSDLGGQAVDNRDSL